MKKSFTILIATLTLLALMTRSLTGLGQTTYTFTSMAWADESNSWSSDKNGSTTGDDRGIAVQKAASGAGATTKNSVSNITSITINAAKSNKGVGSIDVYVGNENVLTQSSFNTTSTDYTVDFNSAKSGKVSFVVTCTTSTIYVKSVTITNSSGPATFSVTYDANGGTGTAPTDGNSYTSGASVTVLGNIGSPALAKDHYTFNGWNTKDDGTGTHLDVGSTFNISMNSTLYAEWSPNKHDVTLPEIDDYGTYGLSYTYNNETVTSPYEVPYGVEVTLSYTPAEGYANYEATWSVNGTPISGNKFTMPDAVVTVTVSVEFNQWVKTSLANLNPADVFVIVGTVENGMDNFETYALPNNGGSSAPIAESITIDGNQIDGKPADKLKWNITGNAKDGYTFYPAGLSTTWLFCATNANTSSNNNMQVGSGTQQGINRNVFVLDDDYLLTNDNKVDRYLSIYINSGTAQDWRGYISSSTSPTTISFYKKVSANETHTLDVAACSEAGGYHLISSPVASVTPSADNGFITIGDGKDYDLYCFDQAQNGLEWRNYKVHTFNIESGKGYLYASKNGTTLSFTGQPYNGNGVVALSYTAEKPFSGWNLIGNPFNATAYLSDSRDFYRMNDDGDGIFVATDNAINTKEGVFVQAADANDKSVVFTTTAPGAKSANSRLVINIVGKSNNVIDRAIVRFDEGGTLEKLTLREDNTKIYIPQQNRAYAVVCSNGKADMPVNFKATQMGKYTISVSTEGIDMDYLHLIDRLTGEDINLLLDNSYSFIASAQDVESRFILSFTATGHNQDADEPFAFQNGSDIIVNGTGELQIFDLMGRMVSTQNVNGIETINVKSQGVYIFRLNEKTQKIVVR